MSIVSFYIGLNKHCKTCNSTCNWLSFSNYFLYLLFLWYCWTNYVILFL